MAEADWTLVTNGLGVNDVRRGVTNGYTRPTGGGNFCFGYHSLVTTTGFAGYFVDLASYNPISGSCKGGSIRAAMKRYASGGNYAPMIGFVNSKDPNTAVGYILGLSEATSYQIALKKGSPAGGLDAASAEILRLSTLSYTTTGDALAGWFHLRLDILVNPHSETVLLVYGNAGNVTAPTWVPVVGMDSFIDDSIGVLTGTVPITTGFYAIFGMYTEGNGTIALFDQIEVYRQTSP